MKRRLFRTGIKRKFRADRSVIYLVAGNVFLIAALIVTVWLITLITST